MLAEIFRISSVDDLNLPMTVMPDGLIMMLPVVQLAEHQLALASVRDR